MTLSRKRENFQRAVSVTVISLISFVGLETLVYINNLYQVGTYVLYSVYIYFFLIIWLHFIFDLHFKESHIDLKDFWRSLRYRFKHLLVWENFRHFQNYLILPGLIYWGSIILIGLNFRHERLQHFIAIVSSLTLVVVYSLFKEIFKTKRTPVHNNHFVILTHAKLYASWLIYSGVLGLTWYYCLAPNLFYTAVFLITFMLLYQACFQFSALNAKNLTYVFLISIALVVASFAILIW